MLRFAFLASVLSVAACASTPSEDFAFRPVTCAPELATQGARCGHVRVPENYAAPSGRLIDLNVIVLPATAPDGAHEAQFEIEGGPGLAVTDTAGFYVSDGAIYRRRRDIVFIDLRGAGGSNPLRCPGLEAAQAADPWAPLYPPELVRQCADDLSAHADLSQYNTANAVRDLDAVRAALGYEHIVLNALSYGTTLALAYISAHPERVRAAALTGFVPADRTPPRFHALAATAALERLFAACAANAACHAAYPDPAGDLVRARAQAGAHDEVFMERVRTQLYSAQTARALPDRLHRAADGDFSDFVASPSAAGRPAPDGVYLSITCMESFGHFSVDDARASARTTPFGDYRLRRQADACAAWPVASVALPPPETIRTPILFVSGELDPVTPADWVEGLAPNFPNARHVVLPGGGHVVEGLSDLDTCFDPLVAAFLDSGDASTLDTSCIARMRPPTFAIQ